MLWRLSFLPSLAWDSNPNSHVEIVISYCTSLFPSSHPTFSENNTESHIRYIAQDFKCQLTPVPVHTKRMVRGPPMVYFAYTPKVHSIKESHVHLHLHLHRHRHLAFPTPPLLLVALIRLTLSAFLLTSHC